MSLWLYIKLSVDFKLEYLSGGSSFDVDYSFYSLSDAFTNLSKFKWSQCIQVSKDWVTIPIACSCNFLLSSACFW